MEMSATCELKNYDRHLQRLIKKEENPSIYRELKHEKGGNDAEGFSKTYLIRINTRIDP